MRFNAIIRASVSPVLVAITLQCAGGKAKPMQDSYARILILNYANRTGSPDFDYLSESLGDATRTAMKARFEYREIVKNENTLAGSEDETIGRLSGEADVLILGRYQKVGADSGGKKSETILVSGRIFSVRQKKLIAEYSKTTVVDARIFTKINEIAQQAVLNIQAYVRKINNDQDAPPPIEGKEALTLERLKLKVFVPPMF